MEYALRQKHTHRHHLYVFARGNTYKKLQKELDSARSKGVLSRNAVSRKKSRMMKLFNVSFAAAE